MKRQDKRELVHSLLDRFGQTFAEEVGFSIRNSPSPLFRWLCFSLLSSTRISHGIAVSAARALSDAGWTTAQKMSSATWRERTDVLNRAGYARYDESTSRMLGQTSELLLEKYDGDLRRLRDVGDRTVKRERELLKECKGIGDVGVAIFFRGVQGEWDELFPYVDPRAARAAHRLKLPADPEQLLELSGGRDFVRLVAALVRVELDEAYEQVTEMAEAKG